MSQLRKLRRLQEPRSEQVFKQAIEIAEHASKAMKGFSDDIAHELGVESASVNLVRDALKARLRERREYQDFLLQATEALSQGHLPSEDTTLVLDTLKARLEEYQVLHLFLLNVTRALGKPELVPGEAAPEEVLREVRLLVEVCNDMRSE